MFFASFCLSIAVRYSFSTFDRIFLIPWPCPATVAPPSPSCPVPSNFIFCSRPLLLDSHNVYAYGFSSDYVPHYDFPYDHATIIPSSSSIYQLLFFRPNARTVSFVACFTLSDQCCPRRPVFVHVSYTVFIPFCLQFIVECTKLSALHVLLATRFDFVFLSQFHLIADVFLLRYSYVMTSVFLLSAGLSQAWLYPFFCISF